jgi:effector-binding domain-containing protein
MKVWSQALVGRAIGAAVLALMLGLAAPAFAQTATPTVTPSPAPTASPSIPPSATPTAMPSATAQPSPTPSAQPSPTPPAATPTLLPNPDMPTIDRSPAGAPIELAPRPAAYFEGKASRDEIYAAIQGSLAIIKGEVDKAGLKPAAHPIAVFLQADDDGFRYRAEIPLETAPPDKTELSPVVKLGLTPAGKAMRFEHRGAYDDIDATYEAITAYLDEKNIDAQDVFVEEYLNEVKTSDDPNLQVDIYVLLK